MKNHLGSFSATLLLAASVSAQIYDNGPLQSGPGVSTLQNTALSHTVYGFGTQRIGTTTDNSVYDDFAVKTAMIIDEVEIFCYQTGSGLTSTITGVYVEFYASDPSAITPPPPISATFATNLVATPNNPTSNAFSGVYRELESASGATNRPIMAVRVKLEGTGGNPMPMTLTTAGVYWIRIQAEGSLSSGPWYPPIVCTSQPVTGNAMQKVTAGTFNNPLLSGPDSQGIPFRLYGVAATQGSIQQVSTGCGPTQITVCGAPNVGGFLRTEITGTVGIPVILYAIGTNNPQTFCGCDLIDLSPIPIWFATSYTLNIPMIPSFGGLRIWTQGADIGGPGGCASPMFNATDGYRATLNM